MTSTVQTDKPFINIGLMKAHIMAGFLFLVVAMLAGVLYSLQFNNVYPFPDIEWLAAGRVRMVHTNGVAFGFIMNVFLGALYWVVPRLTKRRILSDALGWLIFWVYLGIVLWAVVGILLGHAQAVEWGETPNPLSPNGSWLFPIDFLVMLGLILIAVQFLTPIMQFGTTQPMYVSLWYFSVAFIWVILTYAMGNFLPEFVPGAGGATFVGLYIHDLVGLLVTPLGWGMMYYFVPSILKKPIWSHAVSLLGFWGLAFFYPLQGVHHFIYSTIPMFAQFGAVVSTVAIEIMVVTVFINFFMTLRGRELSPVTNIPIRWFYTGMIFYVVTCIQCAVHVQFWAQEFVHFTDWVVGHAHLIMFGTFGFWLIGISTDLWPRIVHRRNWWSPPLHEAVFWLSTIGTASMFISLTSAGLVEGFLWKGLAPWEVSLQSVRLVWLFRTATGLMMFGGVLLFIFNMVMTALAPEAEAAEMGLALSSPAGD
ncbi:MAG: cbb3-type cytochrome c oxidase subunit I [Candidatus Tectimicrobiota bacterium]